VKYCKFLPHLEHKKGVAFSIATKGYLVRIFPPSARAAAAAGPEFALSVVCSAFPFLCERALNLFPTSSARIISRLQKRGLRIERGEESHTPPAEEIIT
jgi:hypothetical protein